MSHMSTGGRRGIAAVFAALMVTTVACGTQKGTEVEDPEPRAPGAIQYAPYHRLPDAAEREKAMRQAERSETPRMSADTAERIGQQQEVEAPAGKRVPDARS